MKFKRINSNNRNKMHSKQAIVIILLALIFLFQETTGFSSSVATKKSFKTNTNFEEWISDAVSETSRKQLLIEGSIPSYVKGTLFRNGGGQWTNGEDMCTHIFDGLAKVSSYEIDQEQNGETKVYFQTKFIKSNWYKKVTQSKGIPASISIGPIANKNTLEIKANVWRNIMAIVNMISFDNPCVNIWNYNPEEKNIDQVSAITDAPPRAQISTKDLSTISSSPLAPSTSGLKGYELFCTTHPEYSKMEKGVTYNIGVELGLNGPKVILTQERDNSHVRSVVARSNAIDGIPYYHSFGVNGKYATVVLQPLRGNLDIGRILKEGYFSVMDVVNYTQVLVFDLENGQMVLDQKIDEKVFFYHSISAAEDLSRNDQHKVSIRLCAYKTPDIITGEHQFMKLDQCTGENGKEGRDLISKGGTFCDVTCNLKDSSVTVEWKDDIQQGFELPTTRYSRSSGNDALRAKHPKYVYAYSAYANGSNEYDSWGLFKFDTEKNCIDGTYQQDSHYVSEPIFVADPDGNDEDDGVLLSQIFDGNKLETALLVLDAKTMKVLGTAWTGQRSPMDFHGTFV